VKRQQIDPEAIIAAVDFVLSSDHVRYEVKNPELIDWLGFLGGISVFFFLVGKLANHCFFRKKYVSPMMDHLFQVQDVSRISNIKR